MSAANEQRRCRSSGSRSSATTTTTRTRSQLRWRARLGSGDQASATIFVIMRRMRAPLIILIVIFAVSVLGLVLIPGEDPAGQPYQMTFLRRLLLHELHRVDDRFRRAAVPVHRQPADVGDHLDLPDGDRLGLRHRVAADPDPGSGVPQCACAATVLPGRCGGSGSRSCCSPGTVRPANCSASRSIAGPAVRGDRPVGRPHRFAGSGRLPRRHPRPGRRCAQSAPSRGGRSRPPLLLRRGRADQRRRGEPGGHHGRGAVAPGTCR